MSLRLPPAARGAATTPALSLFLVAVIALLSFLGVAAPALLADGRTATVQRAVESVPVLARWPSATAPGLPAFDAVPRPATGDAPGADTGTDPGSARGAGDRAGSTSGAWGTVLAALEAKRQEQPEPLRSLLGAPRLTMMVDPQVTRDEDPARTDPVPSNRLGIVSDPGFLARAELVEGRLPRLTDPAHGVEIALTETVAEQLAWPVGSERSMAGGTVTLVGVVAPTGHDDADWAFVSGSRSPVVEVDANGNRILIAAGFMHADEMALLTELGRDIKITAWMPFDATGLDAGTAKRAASQLRLLAGDPAIIPMHTETFYNRGLPFLSALPQAIDAGVARAEVMTSVVTVAAVGPILVALVALALVSRLIAVRRVAPTRVLRARGASTSRLIALLGGEGAVLGVLGAAIGAIAAAALLGWAGAWALAVPAVLAAAPAVALPWGALTAAERQGRSDLGEVGPAGWLRTAWEALILVVTAALAALVLARGGTGGADPLLLALLVLLGVSGCVLSLRLLPVLLRVAERRGRRRTSLSALLGPARARRDQLVRTAPALGVVVGLGVAVFSVVFSSTVAGGITRSAEAGVGADVRVDAAYITAAGADRVAALDGVRASAGLHGGATVEASSDGKKARTRVYAVDRDAFVAVQHDAAAPLSLPAELAEPAGAEGDAVPAVVSERLLEQLGIDDASAGLAPPGGLQLEVSGFPVRVVGIAPSQVPFGTAEQWMIVDAANTAAIGERGTGASQLYLSLAPGADPDAVGAAAVAAIGGDATFETPARAAAVYTEDPAYGIVQGALTAASAVVAGLLALVIIATLLLGAASRARMVAILRTLGLPTRAAGRLVAWEVVPTLLTALPFGVAAGLAMAGLVIPQLDLRGFVGGQVQPPVALGGVWLPLVVLGFSLVAAAAVAAAAAAASRLTSANTIRADDGQA